MDSHIIDQPTFDFKVDPDQFARMNNNDQSILLESLSEKEKWDNLKMFRTSPGNKVEWRDDNRL